MYQGIRRKNRKLSRRGICFWGIAFVCAVLVFFVLLRSCGSDAEEKVWKAANHQMDSRMIEEWLARNEGTLQRFPELGIILPETSELFQISLSDRGSGVSFERMWGQQLKIIGRKDNERRYFEGDLIWEGQEVCILDFNSMEYAVLQENIRSFTLGDYFISCRYEREDRRLELLIFYCPA